ncbi:MAG: hypothetical protein ACRCST_03475 [Turicibacter sp.]
MKKNLIKLGALSIFVTAIATGCSTAQIEQEVKNPSPSISETSPMGEFRKMIDVNGFRYVFLNNGEAFDLKASQLGGELDKIEMLKDANVYEIKGYDGAFRFAVEANNEFFIAQLVSKSDDSAMDIATYFEMANLEDHVKEVQIFDHLGMELLQTLDQGQATNLLNVFSKTAVANLASEDYEAIAAAQTNNESYKVVFILEDGTTVEEYVIPNMGYVTVGDYTCTSDTLATQLLEVLGSLNVVPMN